MSIDFKQSVSDPYATDIGNKSIQGMTVSKTMQFGLFTTNENAVWAASNQLRKESFPFASVSISVNRDSFRLQVGDVFKYVYTPYSSEVLVMRVLSISEESIESENITIQATQDVYSITNTIEEYSAPVNNAIRPTDYSADPFTNQTVIEAPWVLSDTTKVIPMASRGSEIITGFSVYMSTDGGSSYNLIENSNNVQPFGTLNTNYGITNSIDDETGVLIDFVSDVDSIESVSWSDVLSGTKNIALLGDEIISFQNITPVSGDTYKLENVIRGRFGTVKKTHTAGEDFWFTPRTIGLVYNANILPGSSRKFKLVPFNSRKSGVLADATAIDLSVVGESSKPYEPSNFNANGESFDPQYTSGSDITLTWSPRFRGFGAGEGIPGIAYVDYGREGLFKIEVYVNSILVRTTSAIDAETWDYTNAMNVSDNTTPAQEITFILYNYITADAIIYESDAVQVICTRG